MIQEWKRFSFFLLPSDVERLMAELQTRFGARLIYYDASDINPLEIGTPIIEQGKDVPWVAYYLIPPGDVQVNALKIPNCLNFVHDYWYIDGSSEGIKFCASIVDWDMYLLPGGCCYETTVSIGDDLCSKRPEFLSWAAKVFRFIKKSLKYSKLLRAYVGKDAALARETKKCYFAYRTPSGKYKLAPRRASRVRKKTR